MEKKTLSPARKLDKIIAHLTDKGVQVAGATYSPFDNKAFVSIGDDTMLTQALGVSATRVNNDAADNRRYRLDSLQILNPQSEFAFMHDLQDEESQIELSFQG